MEVTYLTKPGIGIKANAASISNPVSIISAKYQSILMLEGFALFLVPDWFW